MTKGPAGRGGFSKALEMELECGHPVVIPDIKVHSPEYGDLMRGRSPLDYAEVLVRAGAPLLSVVTEAEHYGGSLQILREMKAALRVPLLRKDFIRSVADLEESAAAGADAVLLIAAMLAPAELFRLYHQAALLGLETLVEVHTADELEVALSLSPTMLGINNRDILRLELDDGDVGNTQALAAAISERPPFVISESGILTETDVKLAIVAGSSAVLIGTALLLAEDPATLYRRFCQAAEQAHRDLHEGRQAARLEGKNGA